MNQNFKLLISIGIPLLILLIPTDWIPVAGITLVEHRLIAIFLMAMLFWILEPIPIFATSILIIVAELVMISDKCFLLFKPDAAAQNFGTVLSYREIMATFASPIIMLFLGGFFLAMAATKYQLDLNLARVLLKPFGSNPKFVLLGLMIITAVFSMFMSNTATTVMMLAILAPVLKLFDSKDTGRIAFVLAVPFAANIGGIGTPIGTPPNAIAMKYLTGTNAIGFGEWMSFAVPFVIILLVFAWVLLLKFYPPQSHEIKINIRGKFRKNRKAITVYVTFAVTILGWLFDFLHGMNAYIVAMIPVAVFLAARIITAEDMKRISWDVLWLLSGGIALGIGLEKSGLAGHIIHAIPFSEFSPYLIVLLATTVTFLMANFMSHTATANLLLPIMAMLGVNTPSLIALGGDKMLILAVTFSASIGMALPISTPPNALAHATGFIESRHLSKSGIIIGLVGLIGIYIMMYILNGVLF